MDDRKCPIYRSTEIGKGKQSYQYNMYPIDKLFSNISVIIADICTNCGHTLSIRVVDSEKFK